MNTIDYVELHCHSYYSLLDGASSPEDLVRRAAELGLSALAVTDHDALYSAIPFAQAAKKYGIRPLFGAELTLDDHSHLTLLVMNEQGWRNLSTLITLARHNAPKGSASLPSGVLGDYAEGLIALSGCRKGAISQALLAGNWQQAVQIAQQYRAWFGSDHFFLELQNHLLPEDDALNYKLVQLATRLGLRYCATNNVHYAARGSALLHDVLVCIRHNVTLANSRTYRRPNSEYFLKSPREMQSLFADYPAALNTTHQIAEMCQFEPTAGLQDLPEFPTPDRISADVYLAQLCEAQLTERLPTAAPRARELLTYELSVINQHGLANYFLIIWDIIRFARSRGIVCQGRGSAANSFVAWLLGIGPVNPLEHDLVFERFLSPEQARLPDIDIDFQANRREEVIQYIFNKYGRDHVAMACTFVTFQTRMARREIGKVLGMPVELIEERAHLLPVQVRAANPAWQDYERLCAAILDFPRHLSIHNGGMILSREPLAQRVPTEPATMPDRNVVQWDKAMLEIAGMVKADVLSLRALQAISETVQVVAETTGTTIDLEKLKPTDPAVYDRMRRADVVGVSQLESGAQMNLLPQLQPRNLDDVEIATSVIRPGPILAHTTHRFMGRRLGYETVSYAHPILEPILAKTLGVMIWQEQLILSAEAVGQLTRGDSELLRRALGGKGGPKGIAQLQDAFMAGAQRQGISYATAAEIFEQFKAFGGYSFAHSHAAAMAKYIYAGAYLKLYHTAAYMCAILNAQPMGYWSPAVIVNDARQHGVAVLPVSVFDSQAACTLEGPSIRLGLRYVAYLAEHDMQALLAARADGTFSDLPDFLRRVSLPSTAIENLILIGAFDAWGIPRRQLLWELGARYTRPGELPLIFASHEVDLPTFTRQEMLYAEYAILGLSPGDHLMGLYEEKLLAQGILDSKGFLAAPNKAAVRVAGQMVMHRAPPTANGTHFITLMDKDGMIPVIVERALYERYQLVLQKTPLLIVAGQVQQKDGTTNLIAREIASL